MCITDKEVIGHYINGFTDELQHHLASIILSLPEKQLADIITAHLGHSSPHESFINVIVAYNARFVKE